MASLKNPNDAVTVAPGVIMTIVQIAALNVEGVAAMSSLPGSMDRWLRRTSAHDGVRLLLEEGSVRVDIYLLADVSRSLYETCRGVQEAVARTIKEYVGMDVIAVNVHIDDVEFPKLADRNE